MNDCYAFPAVLTYAEDGICVEFPDFPGCYTCGKDEEETLCMATEALELHLFGMERDKEEIPPATPVRTICVTEDQVAVLVRANMRLARLKISNKSVKKTLTIPKWLAEEATTQQVDLSQLLQEALKQRLGMQDVC